MHFGRGRKIPFQAGFAIGFSRSAALLWLCAALLLFAPPLRAQSELFVVRGVAVDVTAGTAVEAREVAISDGHRAALQRLFARLVPLEALGQAPSLSSEQIFALTVDFSVANERTSGVRYLADMTVRFRGDAVQTLLRRNAVSFAVTRGRPVLVLPVFGDQAATRLWVDNPWYDHWIQRPGEEGLVPLLVPLGDLQDLTTVDVAAARALDQDILGDLAARYGTQDVILAKVRLEGDTLSGTATLELLAKQAFGAGGGRLAESFSQEPDETLELLLARAADSLESQVQEAWKAANLIAFDNLRSIFVTALTPDFESWRELRRRLDGVASVQQVRLASLSKQGSDIEISFAGTEQQLTFALRQNDLVLSLNIDSEWELALPETLEALSATGFDESSGQPEPDTVIIE